MATGYPNDPKQLPGEAHLQPLALNCDHPRQETRTQWQRQSTMPSISAWPNQRWTDTRPRYQDSSIFATRTRSARRTGSLPSNQFWRPMPPPSLAWPPARRQRVPWRPSKPGTASTITPGKVQRGFHTYYDPSPTKRPRHPGNRHAPASTVTHYASYMTDSASKNRSTRQYTQQR